uniref:Uncharacterized protein n=1 Tax=Tanacetum cinerariifolium TaxID=118510 RepID=A0A699J2B5_TANCI|nr:hypothetical protein [Tanacetum cinerariifolium]
MDHDHSHPFFLKLLGIAFSWFKGIVEEEECAYPVAKRSRVNDVTRLQAQVDKKKVVVTDDVIREIEEEGYADEYVKEVTAGDDAHRDVSAAHGEVPTVTQEPSIPSPTLPTLPPQPPQDLLSTSQVQQTPPQSPQDDAVILMDDKEEEKKVKEAKIDESAQVQGRQAES